MSLFDFSPASFYDDSMKKYLLIGLLGYWVIGLLSPRAIAQTMQDNKYIIEKKSIDIQPFRAQVPQAIREKPKEEPLASGQNYTVETNSPSSFTFSLSQNSINFGEITATNPVTRPLNLSLKSSTDYQIFLAEDKPLTAGKIPIPDTTCDSGTCTEITPSLWKSALTYGFGYHTSTMLENEYMQFPDLSKNEPLEAIFQGSKATNIEKELIYKVNIAGTQQPAGYENVVTYLATPSF